MVEQCYYKKISESKVINLREALSEPVNLDYRKCRNCTPYLMSIRNCYTQEDEVNMSQLERSLNNGK